MQRAAGRQGTHHARSQYNNTKNDTNAAHKPIIQTLHLLGISYSRQVEESKDESYKKAYEVFVEVITICDETQSLRLGAEVRISLARLLLQWNDASKVKDDIASLIDPVLTNAVTSKFTELYEQAKDLKQQAATGTFKDVIQAMNMVDGYNYGGSWSSHWYECPNGHPYFIGNCGGATSTARCIECGESVGGSSHQLLASNRQFSGSFRALLDLEPLLLSETSHPLFSQSGTTIIYLFSDLLQRLL